MPHTPTRGRPQPVNDRGLAWNWFSYFLISFLAGGLYCLIVFVRYTHGILWAGPTSPIFLGKCIVVWISHAGCNYGGNCGYWYEGHLEHHNNFRWILFSPFLFSSKQVESEAAMPGFNSSVSTFNQQKLVWSRISVWPFTQSAEFIDFWDTFLNDDSELSHEWKIELESQCIRNFNVVIIFVLRSSVAAAMRLSYLKSGPSSSI
jgi:hypothetical protein